MKYKEGDRVKIKSLDWYNENKDEYGYVRCIDFLFTPEHSKYCGYEFTISHITEFQIPSYVMESNGHEWTDEMIEGLVEEENANYSKVIDNGASNPINAKTSSATIDTDKGFYSYSSDGNLEMEWNLPNGYIFKDENDNVINATKIVLEKKKKEYPKTYEECCKVLDIEDRELVFNGEYRASKLYWKQLGKLNFLNKLLICRDAYWKIAGEELGLGKPWEPSKDKMVYSIYRHSNKIETDMFSGESVTFEFPTKEMRNAFYENFKSEIENCKEFL